MKGMVVEGKDLNKQRSVLAKEKWKVFFHDHSQVKDVLKGSKAT